MSEGEVGRSPLTLPADLLLRNGAPDGTRQRPPWLAMLAAALLHLLVLLWLILDWSHPAAPLREPEVIPVQVVMAPPTPPPPTPVPAPRPTPAPTYRESGADQRTTAPAPADTASPEQAAPPPPAEELREAEKEAPPPPPEKPTPTQEKQPAPLESAKPLPRKEVARLEPPRKEAETLQAPRIAPPRHLNIEPGERPESGDPYLNQLRALIERHRVYPRVVGPFGLPAEGTAVYEVALDRSGRVLGMRLSHSSGIAGIDQAVENMIRSSLPFPPLPADYPDEVPIDITIHLFPPS